MNCPICNTDTSHRRAGATTCSTRCRVALHRVRRQQKAHQRIIREEHAEVDPRPVVPLDGCTVAQITREQAEQIILSYEWLATMSSTYRFSYGLLSPAGDLLGVACFGLGGGTNARNLCGSDNAQLAICLERGACVPHAHEHAASFLIANACKQASKDHGCRIFFGYSDEQAGEFGTVYQACNWLYLGRSQGRHGVTWRYDYTSPDDEQYSIRRFTIWLRRRYFDHPKPITRFWARAYRAGWRRKRVYDRARYVWFEGSRTEKKRLRAALKYETQPYPKRL